MATFNSKYVFSVSFSVFRSKPITGSKKDCISLNRDWIIVFIFALPTNSDMSFNHTMATEWWPPTMCILVTLVGILLLQRHRKYRRYPPGPTGLPILGYLPFLGKHQARTYYNLSKRYGPVLSVNTALSTVVVLNDYDSIHEALVKNGNTFSGRPKLAPVADQDASLGIATRTYDSGFKHSRKFTLIAMRSFGFGKQSLEDKITEEIECLLDLIRSKDEQPFDSHVSKDENFRIFPPEYVSGRVRHYRRPILLAKNGSRVTPEIFAMSVSNVLSKITLGRRFSHNDKVFQKMVEGVISSFSDEQMAVALSIINVFPLARFVPPIRGIFKQFQEDVNYNDNILRAIIDEHKKSYDPENTRDFIDEYIKEMQKPEGQNCNFNDTQLVKILHDLFVAGTETTSSTLNWCFLVMAHHPSIQEKVAEEIKDVIGDNRPATKHRDNMHYTQAFLHEITRHRTLAILSVPHVTTDDVVFRGYDIPKDTVVLPNLWAVHHDPHNFENPNEFNPERFLNENGLFVPHKKVIPFSVGPRYCLGQQLAKMELFLFLANIIQNFEIAADPKQTLPDYSEGIVGFAELPPGYEIKFVSR